MALKVVKKPEFVDPNPARKARADRINAQKAQGRPETYMMTCRLYSPGDKKEWHSDEFYGRKFKAGVFPVRIGEQPDRIGQVAVCPECYRSHIARER